MAVEDCLKSIILCLKIDSLKTQALVVKVCASSTLQTSEPVVSKMKTEAQSTMKLENEAPELEGKAH